MKKFQKLTASIRRLPAILFHPREYFSQDHFSWLDGTVAICLLFFVTFLQKLVWIESPNSFSPVGLAAQQVALNTLLAALGFFGLYYTIMILFKKHLGILDLASAVLSASLPLAAVTLISVISWWIGLQVGILKIMTQWIWIQNILSALGLALSWPGWMGYCLLRYSLKLNRTWSIILPVLFVFLLLLGWLLPLS